MYSKEQCRRLLEGIRDMFSGKRMAQDDEWITMKGARILLDDHGNVKGGAGGKFNGRNAAQERQRIAAKKLHSMTPQQMLEHTPRVSVKGLQDPYRGMSGNWRGDETPEHSDRVTDKAAR